jgi:uncharacterized protein (TIGR00730 family)
MQPPDLQKPPPEVSQPNPEVMQKIQELLVQTGADPQSMAADLIGQLIYSSLKMTGEGYDLGQLKLMTRAFKEMRYAYSVFNKHPLGMLVSIFGSARTPEEHPDFQTAIKFSQAISSKGWVCMTGAADGIMRAGLEGAPKESSFGLSIRLPFENTSHTLLAGDPKLINFRYFFTRKLMFLSQSEAFAAFPGGVGTQDELFEVITLMQTGRSNIVPVILLEGEKGTYWETWMDYIHKNLLERGWISLEDLNFFYRAADVSDGVDHILQFYKRYHSSRYVKDTLVIRMKTPLNENQVNQLTSEFQPLIQSGAIYSTIPLPEENDHLELPRIAFEHNRKHFGLLRALIDRINAF